VFLPVGIVFTQSKIHTHTKEARTYKAMSL
jgi:hypothetical protein